MQIKMWLITVNYGQSEINLDEKNGLFDSAIYFPVYTQLRLS